MRGLIMDLLKLRVQVELRLITEREREIIKKEGVTETEGVSYVIGNYGYKEAGCVSLIPIMQWGEERFLVVGRYGALTTVHDYLDLVRLNFSLWQQYKERFDGWQVPESPYVDDMISLGLIEEKYTVRYVPKV